MKKSRSYSNTQKNLNKVYNQTIRNNSQVSDKKGKKMIKGQHMKSEKRVNEKKLEVR